MISTRPMDEQLGGHLASERWTALAWRHWRRLVLAGVFLLACLLRLQNIEDPAADFHATRQYRSFLIARAYYFESLNPAPGLPEWMRQAARASRERQGVLEPPLMELAVATAYRVTGEAVWVPRVLSSLAWLLGGLLLHAIARRIAGREAGLCAVTVYLLAPFAVVASRSFQPDPLAVMLLLASVLAVLRYHERQSAARLLAAAAVSASAILVKPVVAFAVFGVFGSLTVVKDGVGRSLLNGRALIFSIASIAPALVFYGHGLSSGALRGQAHATFLPHLVLNGFFWKGWLQQIRAVAGLAPFFAGLLGVLVVRRGLPRATLVGLWLGYGAFCAVFSYHIATHDYYHLQLIPIVAMSLGPLLVMVIRNVFELNPQWYWRAAAGVLALAALGVTAGVAAPRRAVGEPVRGARVAAEIGQLVGHSRKVLMLASDYGLSLEYHGYVSGWPWPLASDLEWERLAGVPALEAEERFESWFARHSPEYFVVLDLRELEGQPDLARFLSDRFTAAARSVDYVVFDLLRAGSADGRPVAREDRPGLRRR